MFEIVKGWRLLDNLTIDWQQYWNKKFNKIKEEEGNKMAEEVTITKAEYDELLACKGMLDALHSAGVDNWEGYEIAINGIEEKQDGTGTERQD